MKRHGRFTNLQPIYQIPKGQPVRPGEFDEQSSLDGALHGEQQLSVDRRHVGGEVVVTAASPLPVQ